MINRTQIENIKITDNAVVVLFKDSTVGKEWFSEYPPLANATLQERENFTVSYFGIHWPSLDEDLSFDGIYKKAENLVENI
ncbi:MAG: DUF2442 domain-containing protein [Muribaculaceae bacterium]|nr:DUF2442 domain-containing protein [Muribaculaceae bacterium]